MGRKVWSERWSGPGLRSASPIPAPPRCTSSQRSTESRSCAVFSDSVMTSADSDSVARDGAAAVAAAMAPPGRIATLILPADASWNEANGPAQLPPVEEHDAVSPETVAEAVRVLRSGEPVVLFLSGPALREPGLTLAGRIA